MDQASTTFVLISSFGAVALSTLITYFFSVRLERKKLRLARENQLSVMERVLAEKLDQIAGFYYGIVSREQVEFHGLETDSPNWDEIAKNVLDATWDCLEHLNEMQDSKWYKPAKLALLREDFSTATDRRAHILSIVRQLQVVGRSHLREAGDELAEINVEAMNNRSDQGIDLDIYTCALVKVARYTPKLKKVEQSRAS